MSPTKCTGVVNKINKINNRDLFLKILHKNPRKFKFKAGQFINIQVANNTYRAYSICTNPNTVTSIGIIASVEHVGIGANYLKSLKMGDTINYIGPSGLFKLKKPFAQNLHFFATGTGIAPFLSMFSELKELNSTNNIYLYFGIRNENNLFAIKELNNFKNNLKNFEFKIFISQPTDLKKYKPQRITNVLSSIEIADSHFYLCGQPSMVDEIKTSLQNRGIPLENIIYEKFTVNQSTK